MSLIKLLMTRFLFIILYLSLSPYLIAKTTLPKHLVLTYTYHPSITSYHIPIIRQAYKKLGIKVEFIAMPVERDLIQSNRAITDGNVVKPLSRIKQYDNLIAIGQPLDEIRFVLFCRAGKPCKPDILNNPTNIILRGANSKAFDFSDLWQAQIHKIGNLEKFKDLYESKKFDYFTYALSANTDYQHHFKNVNYFILKEEEAYHVLHKKYGFMKEQVSKAIKQVLEEHNVPFNK